MRRGETSRTRAGWSGVARRVPGVWGPAWAVVAAGLAAVGLLAGWTVADPVPGEQSSDQDVEEAIMVAAGQWALERLPSGATSLDPHRSGAGKDAARVRRVARSLGATLSPLDDARQCANSIDPSTCTLSVERVLAISSPRIDGDRAQVKVYAWYRAESAREPVAQRSWNLQLHRSGGGWRVVPGG